MPSVIEALEGWVIEKKTRTYIPPAFYDSDGSWIQPPSFEMPAYGSKTKNTTNTNNWLEANEIVGKIGEGRQ